MYQHTKRKSKISATDCLIRLNVGPSRVGDRDKIPFAGGKKLGNFRRDTRTIQGVVAYIADWLQRRVVFYLLDKHVGETAGLHIVYSSQPVRRIRSSRFVVVYTVQDCVYRLLNPGLSRQQQQQVDCPLNESWLFFLLFLRTFGCDVPSCGRMYVQ